MTFLAPCGHPGIPVTVNYVTCPTCDVPKPAETDRTFSLYMYDKDKVVHSIFDVRIPYGFDYHVVVIQFATTCNVSCYQWLQNGSGRVTNFDYVYPDVLIAQLKYEFTLKVPPP